MSTTIVKVQSNSFNWDDRHGTACASDLGFRAGETPEHLAVESTKTEKSLVFWHKSNTVVDGDVLSFNFVAVSDGKFVTIEIFND